jgi:hypothetical protein
MRSTFHPPRPILIPLALLALSSPLFAGDPPAAHPLDAARIEALVGVKPAASGEELKVSVPQTDIAVVVDGFRITPPMGLTTWAAFTPTHDGAMVMGDVVLQEGEVGAVERAALAAGLEVTALHNHFLRDTPKVMFLHIHGEGAVDALAKGVRTVLDEVRKARSGAAPPAAPPLEAHFDPAALGTLLGAEGKLDAGVYRVVIGRPDVALSDGHASVSTFLGFNTWMAFQGTAARAAVAGDFAMLEAEVPKVIRALVENGIEVAAVHNHMTGETPRIVFLHFWGVGPIDKLAHGLRQALDQTGSRPPAKAGAAKP